MPISVRVEVQNDKQVLKDLERRFGKTAMRRHAQDAFALAAQQEVVPAVRAETPTGDGSSPWRRGTTRWSRDAAAVARQSMPMRDSVTVKRLRRRPQEAAAVMVGIRHYAVAAVVRGTYKTGAHREPQHPYYKNVDHRGFVGNDLFTRAAKRSDVDRAELQEAAALE